MARSVGGNPLKKHIDALFDEGPTHLDVAKRFAKRNCGTCGGDGSQAFLQRPGATDKEARTVRLCGCTRRRIRRAAERMMAENVAESGSQG